MEELTDEWIISYWTQRNCKSKEELKAEEMAALENANRVLSLLNLAEISVTPIIFDEREFDSTHAFALAMDIVGKRYADVDDIVVRYAKPENKETNEVYAQFHVLKIEKK
jgi:hypothetical protein